MYHGMFSQVYINIDIVPAFLFSNTFSCNSTQPYLQICTSSAHNLHCTEFLKRSINESKNEERTPIIMFNKLLDKLKIYRVLSRMLSMNHVFGH